MSNIPSDFVNDIAYAFWNINADGTIITGDSWADTDKRFTDNTSVSPPDSWNDTNSTFFGNFGQFKKLRDQGKQINISLAIGGWSWSKNFSPAMSTSTTRTNLVTGILNTFRKYPIFTGVSIDWEYPSNDNINYGLDGNTTNSQDCDNFILFLQQLRSAFDANGMVNYIIAMCCTAAPDKCKWPVEQIHPLINQLQIMSYDMHDGSWGETVSAFHTNPRKSSFGKYSCEEAADYYLSRGVPSLKIFIGGALYSRGYSGTKGPGSQATGGSPDMSWEKGIVDYKKLPLQGATEYNDPESKAAYSYDSQKQILNTYDNNISIIEKCKIIYEKNLGGIILWDNSSDKSIDDPRNITKTLYDNLTHGTPNLTPVQPPNPTPIVPTPTPTPNPTPTPTPNPMPIVPMPTPTPNPTPIVPMPTPMPNCQCKCMTTKMINISFDVNISSGNITNGKFILN